MMTSPEEFGNPSFVYLSDKREGGFPEEAAYWTDDADGDPVLPVPDVDPEPRFVIRGTDPLAPAAIAGYMADCTLRGLHAQAREVQFAYTEVVEWQKRNPGAVKLPDHEHVPARPGGGS